MYTKDVHVRRPYKVAEPHISHIQRDNVFGRLTRSNLKPFDYQACGQRVVNIHLNFYLTFSLFRFFFVLIQSYCKDVYFNGHKLSKSLQ